jgi:predicted Zn-ribbon and HTH transcriptional regulator
MKNLIYIGVIVICLLVAGIVLFTRGSDGAGLDSISNDDLVWVLCLDCGHAEQMGKKDYYVAMKEKSKELTSPRMIALLTCTKCGKDAVTKAIKCEKCGHVFRDNAVPNDYPDRCPKCKYSKTEAARKENLAK